jgi:hypothetical protein
MTDLLSDLFAEIVQRLLKLNTEDYKQDRDSFVLYYKEKFFSEIITWSLKLSRLSSQHFVFFDDRHLDSDDEADEKYDNKNKQREDLKYLVRDICKLIGFEEVLKLIASGIKETTSYIVEPQNTPLSIYCELESQFYVIYTIMKRASEKNDTHKTLIRELLGWILKLNYDHIKV